MRHLLLLIALAGCTMTGPDAEPGPSETPDTCDAARFGDLIGQDVTALERRLHLGPVRVIRPGDMVTLDFRPERLNIRIDDNDVIESVECG